MSKEEEFVFLFEELENSKNEEEVYKSLKRILKESNSEFYKNKLLRDQIKSYAKVPNFILYDSDIIIYKNSNMNKELLSYKLKKYYKKPIQHRGTYSYQPGSRCGWHTNSNSPGKRIYFTWTEEDNKSFFKYLDNETDQIITKYDKKGWHINEFIIPKEGVFWHYVGSETCRKSIGFLISL